MPLPDIRRAAASPRYVPTDSRATLGFLADAGRLLDETAA